MKFQKLFLVMVFTYFTTACSNSSPQTDPTVKPPSGESRGSDAKIGPSFQLENPLLEKSCRGSVKVEFTPVSGSLKTIPWTFKVGDTIILSSPIASDGFYTGLYGDYDYEGAEFFSGIPEDSLAVNCEGSNPILTVLASKPLFLDESLNTPACSIEQGQKLADATVQLGARSLGGGNYLVNLRFEGEAPSDCPVGTPLYFKQPSASILFGNIQRTIVLYPVVVTSEVP